MDKVHYCERFIELMIDLEVRQIICIIFTCIELLQVKHDALGHDRH